MKMEPMTSATPATKRVVITKSKSSHEPRPPTMIAHACGAASGRGRGRGGGRVEGSGRGRGGGRGGLGGNFGEEGRVGGAAGEARLREVAQDVAGELHDDGDDHAARRVGEDGRPDHEVEAVEGGAVLAHVRVVHHEGAGKGDGDGEDAQLRVAHLPEHGRTGARARASSGGRAEAGDGQPEGLGTGAAREGSPGRPGGQRTQIDGLDSTRIFSR